MPVIHFITSLTSFLTAIIYFTIAAKSLSAFMIHFARANLIGAGLTGGAAIVALFISYNFLVPARRDRWVRKNADMPRRFTVTLGLIAVLAIVVFAGLLMLASAGQNGIRSMPANYVLGIAFFYVLLFLTVFILPGLAFYPYRKEPAEKGTSGTTSPQNRYQRVAEHIGSADLQNESRTSRYIRVVVGAIFVIFLVGWMYSSRHPGFAPFPDHLVWVHKNWWMIAGLTGGLLAASSLALDQKPGRWIFRNTMIQKAFFVFLFGIFGALFAPATALIGLPALHALAYGAPNAEQKIEIVELGRHITRRGCNRSALGEWPNAPQAGTVKLCSIPDEIWEGLQVGDVLRLRGRQTNLGLLYTSVQK